MKPNIDKMIERLSVLKMALDVAKGQEKPRFIAIKNSFRDLADCFSPVPDLVQKVIIFREKHGNLHYDASTKENTWWAFYDVLKNRDSHGYWYSHLHNLPPSPSYPMPPTTPLNDAEGAEEPIANAIKAMWNKYNSEVKEIDSRYEDKAMLDKALDSEGKDASAAAFLRSQHEDYTIETVYSPPEAE